MKILKACLLSLVLAGSTASAYGASPQTNPINVGLDRIDQRTGTDNLYRYRVDGTGVNIFVLDTWVYDGHDEFPGGKVTRLGDFCQPLNNGVPVAEVPGFSYDTTDAHGTRNASFAAGAQAGVAKGARIYSLDVICQQTVDATHNYQNQSTQATAINRAVDYIIQHYRPSLGTPAVINLSFAFDKTNTSRGLDTANVAWNLINDAIKNALNNQIAVAVSAGCIPSTDTNVWRQDVLAAGLMVAGSMRVGASNGFAADSASSAAYGAGLSLFAPAMHIQSALVTGPTAYGYDPFGNDSGNCADSYASPHVAGVLALYLQLHPNALPVVAKNAIMSNATTGILSGVASGTSNRMLNTGVLNALADVDGDGATDVTIYRPTTAGWWTLKSSTNFSAYSTQGWGGISGDLTEPGDYDGDGKMDLAIFRPSNVSWYVLLSGANFGAYNTYTLGQVGDLPVPGDYDGDGRTDVAVFRPSTGQWLVLKSSTNFTSSSTYGWGLSGDVAVPGDYDGDGKIDLAVFRPSTLGWWILWSSTNFATYNGYSWGLTGDVPVNGDYDGDGRTDVAVYRPSTGGWWILYSKFNFSTYSTYGWGLSGDVPLLKRP